MATDLNLHRKTLAVLPADCPDETRTLYEREIMNRERTWLYSFIADRSVSTQMGKPYSIPKEDFIVRNAKSWYREAGAQKTDVGLSAMVEMHRIVGRIIDTLYSDTRSVSGLNAHLDYTLLMRSFLGQLDQWRVDWTVAFPSDADDPSDGLRTNMRGSSNSSFISMERERRLTCLYLGLADYYHSYYRLFLLSFAVQHAMDDPESNIDLSSYCVLCFESASNIITIARDFLGPSGALRFGIDSTYVYLSYAATFLLKLINPTFTNLVDASVALALVRDAADTLERCAVDDTHTPALCKPTPAFFKMKVTDMEFSLEDASFLRALIENKRTGGRTAPASRVGTQPNSPVISATPLPIGIEHFIRSRAGSAAPEGGIYASMGEGDSNDFTAFDSIAMDTMLAAGGFWDNMLMPGFGGPLQGLSGGTGTMLGAATDPWSMTPLHSRPGSPNGAHSSALFDFGLPGGEAWHPYGEENLFESSPSTESTSSSSPIPYSDLLASPTRASDTRLDFARGRSILLVGESLDRDNAASFCEQHGNSDIINEDPHMSFACRLPDLDLNMTAWFTTGMRPEDTPWYFPHDPKPSTFEDRWEEKFLPTLPLVGTPSLVIVTSHYWDLKFMQDRWWRHREMQGLPGIPYHVSSDDLLWHRKRVVKFITLVRTTFPDAEIMWRLGTKWQDDARAGFGDGNLGVFRINQSMRALMKYLKVPLFNWAMLLEGEKEGYRDGQHFKDGQPGSLFASMVMLYLKKAVTGESTCL
ncbi:hypothetical protein P7C70_g7483, partial [Phenoliferia sp. Uapishka_3]